MAAAQRVIVEKHGSRCAVRDTNSGLSFPLKGYGAMKGQIAFHPDVDLTKPIAEQMARILRRKKSTFKASKAVA